MVRITVSDKALKIYEKCKARQWQARAIKAGLLTPAKVVRKRNIAQFKNTIKEQQDV